MDLLNKQLESEKPTIVTVCQIGNPETVEIVATARFDFAVLDMEHGRLGIDAAASFLRTARVKFYGDDHPCFRQPPRFSFPGGP